MSPPESSPSVRRLKRGLCKRCERPVQSSATNTSIYCKECRYNPERMAAHGNGRKDPITVIWLCRRDGCDRECPGQSCTLCRRCAAEAQKNRGKMRKGKRGPWQGRQRSTATRSKIAQTLTGRELSPEAKARSAELVRLGITGRKLSIKNRYEDARGRVFWLRSSWELAAARYLDSIGAVWDYEPESIRLPNGDAYLPDFRLETGAFIEVKGYMDEKDASKISRAREMGYAVEVWDKTKLDELGILPRRQYKSSR